MSKRLNLVLLALIAVIVIGVFLPQNWKAGLQGLGWDVFGPATRLLDRPREFFSQIHSGFKSLDEAEREVKVLRATDAALKTENDVLHDLSAENTRLREMLDFKQGSHYKLLACRVVSRDPSNWWNTVIINRGWTDNEKLAPDLPVVTPRGLVGKTGLVQRDLTEVILMINQNCRIAATVEGSHDRGIVVGLGAPAEGKPRVKMEFLPRNAQISVGERVFTSGVGTYAVDTKPKDRKGVFPPGLFLGTVLDAPPLSGANNFGLYREATIDPALDLTQLDELFVILPN